MDELKPCPFCGGKSYAMRRIGFDSVYFVLCDKCGCRTANNFYSPKDAIEAWNRRLNNE